MLCINLMSRDTPAWAALQKKVKRREVQERFYWNHRERLRAESKNKQAYNTRYAFLWSLKNEYEITIEEYDRMLIAQSGRCAACGCEGLSLHIDHDHETHKVRGLLCGNCNRALGMVKDSIQVLLNLAAYLQGAV